MTDEPAIECLCSGTTPDGGTYCIIHRHTSEAVLARRMNEVAKKAKAEKAAKERK